MKKKALARIWVHPDVKKRIKIGAAGEGCTISEFLNKNLPGDKNEDTLDSAFKKNKKKGGFDFPF